LPTGRAPEERDGDDADSALVGEPIMEGDALSYPKRQGANSAGALQGDSIW